MRLRAHPIIALAASLGLAACATTPSTDANDTTRRAAFASTYQPAASVPTLIRGATVFDGEGAELANADVLMQDGRIAAIGANLAVPEGAAVIDGAGRFVTPGIIDAHSHLGAYPSPGINATSDGNEATQPNTAEVWVEHSVWPQDPGFLRAVAGGITTLHILPGSANLFGGRGVTLRPVLDAVTVQEMKFPDAPQTLKMACGENPSRVYGGRNSSPATGMGNVAGYRQAWANAQRYARRLEAAENGDGEPPDRDLELETMAGVLNGEIRLQWHCYRADEMANAIEISHEFDFEIAAFHHAVESYKIADMLREEGICSAMWADWWGFKIEAYDGIRENIPFVHEAGACAIVHSDSEVGVQRLNQEAAKAMADGNRAGLDISRAEAWTWLSRNPARALGIENETGTLAAGRRADVVVWSADPLSSYAVAERVYMDGALVYERGAERDPPSDFELGQTYTERAQ
ncbi:MAG: amidohydrolase family protein [Hyphomonadaceae bacterium JAD_PAG50586_4]|nr:MAG: amidohydrolase family protein [Hyphomonadaceae bacterium JAD_PAG50586_4]